MESKNNLTLGFTLQQKLSAREPQKGYVAIGLLIIQKMLIIAPLIAILYLRMQRNNSKYKSKNHGHDKEEDI